MNKALHFKDVSKTLPRHPTRKYNFRPGEAINMAVIHTTNWDTTVEKLVNYDITPFFWFNGKKIYNHISKKGCPECTYHDIIMDDGYLYHCVDYGKTTWHAGKWNTRSVAIALMYLASDGISKVDNQPPDKAISRLNRHLVSICLGLKILPKDVRGHRELEDTGWRWRIGDNGMKTKSLIKWCPGQFVDMDTIRWTLTRRLQKRLLREGYYTGAVDGIFGPLSTEALYNWEPRSEE